MAIYRLSRKDRGPELATAPFAFFPIALTAVIFLALLIKSWPLLSLKSLSSLIFSTTWLPSRGHFGLWPFVLGTLWVTITAFLLAVPVSILTSLYLSEYAPARVRRVFQPVLDLLAGLPSVIYGMWGSWWWYRWWANTWLRSSDTRVPAIASWPPPWSWP